MNASTLTDRTGPTHKGNEWAMTIAIEKLQGRVSSGALNIAIALARFVPFDGSHRTCWPSQATISKLTGIRSREAVGRGLAELESGGHISRFGVHFGIGRRCAYELLFVGPRPQYKADLRLVEPVEGLSGNRTDQCSETEQPYVRKPNTNLINRNLLNRKRLN